MHLCTVLQRDTVITQQGLVGAPAFTFATVYTERSVALVVSRLSVVYYDKALSKYISDLDITALDILALMLTSNDDYERVALESYKQIKLKRYRYAGPVLQNEYSTIVLHNIIHAQKSISYLLNRQLLPVSLATDIFKILKSVEASRIRDRLKSDFQTTSQILLRLASYFSDMELLLISHEPYSSRLSDKDASFIIRTTNPYFSIVHVPRGLAQIATPTPAQLTSLLNAFSPSEQAKIVMESGCTLSVQILSNSTADALNQEYPHTLAYLMRHYFFLPTLVPLLLPFYNINRIFPVLTDPHLSYLYSQSPDSVDAAIFSNEPAICTSPLSLKPSIYIELAKRYDLRSPSDKSVWLTLEVSQPLSRIGYMYAPYVILSTAFSTHTLHPDDSKVIFDRVKTFEEQKTLYFCQGRLATEISSSGVVLSDIGMLKHAVLNPINKSMASSDMGAYSLADAVIPIFNQSPVDGSASAGYFSREEFSEVLSPFSNKVSALEQQLAVIHAVYEDLYLAITAGPPAHLTNDSNIFYCLSCEDSWRAYRLDCFKYWQGVAPCIDSGAAKALDSCRVLLETDTELCSYHPAKALSDKPVQLSKKDLRQYTATQVNPLPLCSLMKRPILIDKRWALQQQVILYVSGMEKRFVLSTGQIYFSIRLHYPQLNLYIIRIETARILTCGQFIAALVLIEDINLSLSDYLNYLSDSIVFTHVPPASTLPSTSVYHCLFTFSLDGAFIGIQPLLLGGLGRYYRSDDADAFTIRTLGIPTRCQTKPASKVATASFDSTFPVYTGPLVASLYTRILSDVASLAVSVSSGIYICLHNLHLVLHLDVLTGEKTLMGCMQSLVHPYSTRFVVSSSASLPIFMDMKLQSILLPASASSLVGELLSDYTDTEVVDILQKDHTIDTGPAASIATYALEESDEIRTPGYCTDTSEGEVDSKRKGSPTNPQTKLDMRFSLLLSDNGRQFLRPRLFKPNRLSITHYSKKHGVSLIFDDTIMHFPHYPVAISRFHLKDTHLIAVIGQGRNKNYWGVTFTECTFGGSCSLVRQMVVDLGVPYICESHPVLNTTTSQAPPSSTGKISTASISCTGDSLIFTVPTKSLMPGNSGQMIPATRLVEVGFYTELRQVAEIAGVYRTHTPFRIVNHQMRPVEGCLGT